ncbi:hypothetical protein [Pseudomonas putida]
MQETELHTVETTDAASEAGVIGDCALCDAQQVILKESHSIPKFVYDWLKSTSKTPYIRSLDNVNVRHQDGPKEHLLCGDCEGKLSVLEKELAEHLFKKIANYQQQKSVVTVTENMRVAVLSIFWRTLLTTSHAENTRTDEDQQKLEEFLAYAKASVLLNKCDATLYIAPFHGEPPFFGMTKEFSYGLERSIGAQDMRFLDDPHRFFAVFKLPFMYFYILSNGWPADEFDKATEFKAGTLDISAVTDIPSILKLYISRQHDAFLKSKQLMDEFNLEQIKRDVLKNDKITGSDKSQRRSDT